MYSLLRGRTHRLILAFIFTGMVLSLRGSATASAIGDPEQFWYSPTTLPASLKSVAWEDQGSVLLATENKPGGGLFRSANTGLVWEKLSSWQPNNTSQPYNVVRWSTKQNAFLSYNAASVYKTIDNGTTWAALPYPTSCNSILTLQPHPGLSDTIYIGTSSGFGRSLDGGASWQWQGSTPCGSGPRAYSIAAVYDTVYAASTNGLARSDNRGETWQDVTAALNASAGGVPAIRTVVADPENETVAYVLTEDGRVFGTTNSAASWSQLTSGLNGTLVETISIINNNLHSVANNRLMMLDLGEWVALDLPALPPLTVGTQKRTLSSGTDFRYHALFSNAGFLINQRIPIISATLPREIASESQPLTLLIEGYNFSPLQRVYWNGQPRPTTYNQQDGSLSINLSEAELREPSIAVLTVGYPSPSGGVQGQSLPLDYLVSVVCTVNQTRRFPCTAELRSNENTILTYDDANDQSTVLTIASASVTATTTLLFVPQRILSRQTPRAFARIGFTIKAALPNATFQKPVNVTINYNESTTFSVKEQSLALYHWNGATWIDATTTCATPMAKQHMLNDNRLVTSVCRTGEYALLGTAQSLRYLPLATSEERGDQ